MTIPFLDLFKKFTARRGAEEPPAAEPARSYSTAPAKPNGERLSKTVMPNTTRTSSSATDFFKAAGDSSPNIRAAASRVLPPTVALALQPKVERAISLPLSEVLERVPAGFLKPAEQFDVTQGILLKASEIEKGMADGKPAVSLFSIYEQVPDIFVRNVRPDDATQISVPHGKVLEQLRKMQVRDDQDTETAVPQVDTPILKVTIEDTARFGTKLPAVTTSERPSVKVEPATAKAISRAEPEPAAKEKAVVGTAVPRPTVASAPPAQITPVPATTDPVTPARIPFKLPPKGTDEAAKERVPASNSSSVPPSAPAAVAPPATRIPFRMTPPSDDLKPKLQIVPGVVAADIKKSEEPAATVASGAKLSLGLRAVAQNMPSFQLHKPADSVAADARFELPLSLVQPQLASGRVCVPIKVFRDALPEEYQSIVVIDAGEAPVLLPLQEVLKNLSTDALKMRDDQVVDQVAEAFETPFSIKAAEDARRFSAEVESAKTSEAAPVENKKAAPAPTAEDKLPKAEPSLKVELPVKAPRPEPGPVLKLPPLASPSKPVAPVDPKVENKAPTIALPISKSAELKPTVTADKKSEALPATAASPIRIESEAKPVASTATPVPAQTVSPKVPLQDGALSPKPMLKLATDENPSKPETPPISAPKLKTEEKPAVAPGTVSLPIAQPASAKNTPHEHPVTPPSPFKLSPAPAATSQKEARSTEPLKVPANLAPAPAIKSVPAAPKAALPELSQPVLQNSPVPSQLASVPVAPRPTSLPIVPAAKTAEVKPAQAESTPTPNKSEAVAPARTILPVPVKLETVVSAKPPAKPEMNTSAKAVVDEAARLEGISAATVLFEDGLALAGGLPDDLKAGGLCAVAPSLLQKINRHTVDSKFGALASMTLDWRDHQLTFFKAGTVCLGVLHSQPVLPGETHGRLTALTGELSRTYAPPGNTHVDH